MQNTGNPDFSAPDFNDPKAWWMCIEAAAPATLLVIIQSRLGAVASVTDAEDILQETYLKAWQAKARLEWRGHKAFRSWLLTLADHCIADRKDHVHAARRDVGRTVRIDWQGDNGSNSEIPAGSTTPSRVAMHRERAAAIRSALEQLPDEVREVIRLRLIEQMEMREVAEQLSLPLTTVQHRCRRGAVLFRDRLREVIAGHLSTAAPTPATPPVSMKTCGE